MEILASQPFRDPFLDLLLLFFFDLFFLDLFLLLFFVVFPSEARCLEDAGPRLLTRTFLVTTFDLW